MKKQFILTFLFLIFIKIDGFGQEKEIIFEAVKKMPNYVGGTPAMYKFINENLKYPTEAVKNKVEGKVFAKFVIKKDGSIGDVIILKGIGHGCDEEVIRVIKNMPKWIPGEDQYKPVNVYYRMPIVFKM